MGQQFIEFPASSAAGSNASVGTNTNTAPTSSTEVGYIDPSGNLQGVSAATPLPVTIISEPGAPFHTIVDSSALPTGASTSANQTTEITALQAIEANQTNGTQHAIIDSSALPAGAATSALQTTMEATLTAIQANQTNGTQSIIGTGAAGTPSTGVQTVQGITGGTPLNVTSSGETDLTITGQGTQTTLNNNIILASAGATSTPVAGYRSASVQINSTGTAGAYIFEGSNDNVNFVSIPAFNQLILTGTPITAAVTATATNIVYILPITTEFIRVRISTAITGGSLQAFTRLSPIAWVNPVLQVAQNTAANLLTTSTIASGTLTTVASVTSSQVARPGIISDVTSAAIVTTTTTATFTPTFGSSYLIDIPVTAVTGTTPTMAVQVQESADSGTNWYTVYTFPTITATGSYTSPVITMTGNVVRYVQTIGGTTPSFTRAINRLQSSQSGVNVPTQGILTDNSAAVTTSSAQLMAANPQRKYLLLQNPGTVTVWFNFTTAAALTQPSYQLPAGGSFVQEASFVSTEAINVIAASSAVITAKQA